METKHYKKFSNNQALKFWKQTKEDAERIDKFPLMLLRENDWKIGTWLVYFDFISDARILLEWDLPWVFAQGPGFRGRGTILRVKSEDLFAFNYQEFLKIARA